MNFRPRIAHFLAVLPGLIIIAIQAPELRQRWDFVHQAVAANAKIVGFESELDTRPPPQGGGLIFHSVFVFKDHEKVRHRARTEKASYPAAYHKGDKIAVLYLPNDPSAVKVRSFSELWGDPGLIASIGAAFSIAALTIVGLSISRRTKRKPLPACSTPINDQLKNFTNVIKQNYPTDYPDICALGAEVITDAPTLSGQAEVADSEFPKLVASLDYVSFEKVQFLTTMQLKSELTRGSDPNDPIVAKIQGGIRGWGAPDGQEVTLLQLAQHQLLFLRWNEQSTKVFKDDKLIAQLQGTFGKRVTIQIGDKDTVLIKYPTWWWQKTTVTLNTGHKIPFPKTWPNPNGFSPNTVTAFAALAFQTQIILIAVLLWRNNYSGRF